MPLPSLLQVPLPSLLQVLLPSLLQMPLPSPRQVPLPSLLQVLYYLLYYKCFYLLYYKLPSPPADCWQYQGINLIDRLNHSIDHQVHVIHQFERGQFERLYIEQSWWVLVRLFWKKTHRRIPKNEIDMVPIIAPSLSAFAPSKLLCIIVGKILPSKSIKLSFISGCADGQHDKTIDFLSLNLIPLLKGPVFIPEKAVRRGQ